MSYEERNKKSKNNKYNCDLKFVAMVNDKSSWNIIIIKKELGTEILRQVNEIILIIVHSTLDKIKVLN